MCGGGDLRVLKRGIRVDAVDVSEQMARLDGGAGRPYGSVERRKNGLAVLRAVATLAAASRLPVCLNSMARMCF